MTLTKKEENTLVEYVERIDALLADLHNTVSPLEKVELPSGYQSVMYLLAAVKEVLTGM